MLQSSGVIEFNLYSGLVDGGHCSVDSMSVELIILNLFNCSPGSNVRFGCICAIIVVTIVIITIVIAIASVIGMIVIVVIVSPIMVGVGVGAVFGQVLTFFVTHFGLAFRFHVSKVVAVIALHFAHIGLLHACGKSFFIIVVAFLYDVMIIFIRDEEDGLG